MSNKSWGHTITRQIFPFSEKCSATRCDKKPIFRCTSTTSKGTRNYNYCYEHGSGFAKNNDLSMPIREVSDVLTMNLGNYTNAALEKLMERIQHELQTRAGKVFRFEFDETGPMGKRPYAAILRYNSKLVRDWLDIPHEPLDEDRVQVKGVFEAKAGDVVESRVAADGDSWRRHLILEDGGKLHLGDKGDDKADKLVVQYLEGKLTIALLKQKIKK